MPDRVYKVFSQIEAADIGHHAGYGTGPYFVCLLRGVIGAHRNADKGGKADDPQQDPGVLTVQSAGLADFADKGPVNKVPEKNMDKAIGYADSHIQKKAFSAGKPESQ